MAPYKDMVYKLINNDFFKNVMVLMTGTTLAQAIPILVSPVLTRIYSPEQYGTLALFMSIVTVIAVIATFRYELSIMLPASDEDAINVFALAVFIALILSLFIILIILGFNQQFSCWLNNPSISTWLYFVPLMVLLIGLYQSMHYWMSRHRQYRRLATAQVIRSGVKAGTQVGLVYIIPSVGTAGLITGAIVGQLIGTIVIWVQASKEIIGKVKYVSRATMIAQSKEYKKFPLINAPHALINNLASSLPVILLTSFFSATIAGFYSLSLTVIMLPSSLISNAIGQVFYQRISQAYNNRENLYPLVIRLVKVLFLLAIVPFMLLFVFAPHLFSFIFGQEWIEAGKYTRILVPWILMRFVVAPLSYIPLTLGFQAKAFRIELTGFMAVIIALSIGASLDNLMISLILLSLFSFLILLYSFLWMVNISKQVKYEVLEER